jgi:hypothetical protein
MDASSASHYVPEAWIPSRQLFSYKIFSSSSDTWEYTQISSTVLLDCLELSSIGCSVPIITKPDKEAGIRDVIIIDDDKLDGFGHAVRSWGDRTS